MVTAGLRDIMNYSVAGPPRICFVLLPTVSECVLRGMVALPREVSGELSAATSFEVKSLEAIFRYSRYARVFLCSPERRSQIPASSWMQSLTFPARQCSSIA